MIHNGFKYKGKIMKKILLIPALILFSAILAWGIPFQKDDLSGKPQGVIPGAAQEVFKQNIPSVAREFIGVPYEYGGNPMTTGTADNSYLFFSIYARAAQIAGLTYYGYLPMENLLQQTKKVPENQLQKGDLMVLNNHHAAMIYNIEAATDKLFLIYASEKRRKVISFNSNNIVFDVFWLENLKGFYRLTDTMLRPAR